jgi:Protein of unknown function (DUF2846)
MKRKFVLVVICGLFGACATNASGPNFSELRTTPLGDEQARVYVFRDKVFYAVQAPYIVKAKILIDGREIGNLANGGFLVSKVEAGQHSISATSASDITIKYFYAAPESEIYIEIYDKTRMEGARAAAGAAEGALIAKAENEEVAVGATRGALAGFFYSKNSNEGRIWGMDYITEQDALPRLRELSLSE